MRRLLIFVKYPTPGTVKTRLAASLGAEAASEIARVCTELTLERLTPCRRESVLCVDPPEAMARTRRWLGSDWPLQPQGGATLGARLSRAMQQAFAEAFQAIPRFEPGGELEPAGGFEPLGQLIGPPSEEGASPKSSGRRVRGMRQRTT